MAKYIDQEIAHYYDVYPTEEDELGESIPHAQLVHYLMEVLKWHFHGQTCALCENLNFYQTTQWREDPLAPDVAVIKGIELELLSSWTVDTTGLPPQVAFEIASKKTWDKDLTEKPARYALMGVEEYFAYDPNTPLLKKKTPTRLYGWHLNKATGLMQPMTLDADGRLWSAHLESFLVPDKEFLRLYDRNGLLRLTGEEAEARRADAEAKARLAETRRADALAEKLRSLGIDPNQI